MDGMLPGDWKRLDKTIRVAVTRAIVQGFICIALIYFIAGLVWMIWQDYIWPWITGQPTA